MDDRDVIRHQIIINGFAQKTQNEIQDYDVDLLEELCVLQNEFDYVHITRKLVVR